MSTEVTVALISLIGVIITVVIAPLAAFAWRQWKKRLAEAEKRGREAERAKVYEQKATAVIDQKNAELSEAQAENEELRSWLSRLTDHDIPHMLRKLDERDRDISKFADAYKKLSDQRAVESWNPSSGASAPSSVRKR